MPLLNYTTTIATEKSFDQVHRILVKAGARTITGLFDDDGEVTGLRFNIVTEFGPRAFSLPVNVDKVQAVLEREGVQQRFRTTEHAGRVAWRILKDWIEAQLAIIQTEMVTFDQVMLPYMTTELGTTVYELYTDNNMRAIGAGDGHEA